jgi:hypothetical protein
MAKSDAISVHIVLSREVRGIIGAEDIGRMKKVSTRAASGMRSHSWMTRR